MKYLKDCLKTIFISPEFLFLCLGILLYQFYDSFFIRLGLAMSSREGADYFFTALPVSMLIASYKIGVIILRPGDDAENKILYQWPFYRALEFRVYWSIFLCLVCTSIGFVLFADPFLFDDSLKGLMLFISLSTSVSVIIALFLAKMAIKKILTLYK